MKKNFFLFAALFLASCSSSSIYSPYMHAPAAPMHKDQGQIVGAAGLLPKAHIENNPKEISGIAVGTFGGELALRYAFSSRLALQGKIWNDLRNDNILLGGFSFSGIFRLDTAREGIRWALVPQFGMTYEDNSIEGKGLAISALVWFPKLGFAQPYAAFGPAVGTRYWDFTDYQWGWGILANLGAGFELSKNFTATVEIAAAYQADQYEKKNFFLLAPSIGLSWSFENR